MPAAPLESLAVLGDGTIASSANFFKPTSDFAKSLLGAGAGNPDANNGSPNIVRQFATGLLGFSNALGNTTYPGAAPASVYDDSAAHSVTVPAGQMLVVTQLAVGTSLATGDPVTVNDGTNTTTVCLLAATANFWSGGFAPFVLDQSYIFTTPRHAGFLGFYVLRDTAVTPFYRALVAGGATYTVPAGKTAWLLGACITASAASAFLLAGGAQNIAFFPAGVTSNVGAGNGNGLSGPVPLAAGTILTSSSASPIAVWGVLI